MPRQTFKEHGPHPVDYHVGKRVRLRRIMLGQSQTTAANAIGLTFQQLQKYERGANRISASKLWELAKHFNVPVSFFFDDMPKDISRRGVPERDVEDPLINTETMKMFRHYNAIPNKQMRATIREMMRAMATA